MAKDPVCGMEVDEKTAEHKAEHILGTSPTSRVICHSRSLCPECVSENKYDKMIVDSIIYEEGGTLWQSKNCIEHGVTTEVYWEDYDMYARASKFQDQGIQILNPNVVEDMGKVNCPLHCGLCPKHRSHTALGNVVITNRCNLRCWYCFFYAKEGDKIYEPELELIRSMMNNMREEKPVGTDVVQITGGEPTLRDDLLEIIKIAREEGYTNVQLNTNGIRLSKDLDLVRQIKDLGNTGGGHIFLYMSFDGVTPRTNPKNYWEVPGTIENCRKVDLNMVLVPTVIKGLNDHELGDIVSFASSNVDVIRGVNFQPVSLVGRMPRRERKRARITIPKVIKEMEEQTGGWIRREDFFPVPSVCRLTDFMEMFTDEKKYRLSNHFACGMATYLLRKEEKLVPITRFIDVESLFEYLNDLTNVKSHKFEKVNKPLSFVRLIWEMKNFLREGEKPENFDIKKALIKSMINRDYNFLRGINEGSLFIGMMHFQDLYNYDVDRVRRCNIHYATPDGRIIPFCAFNVLPELYRDEIQEKYGITAREWEKANNKSLLDDKYKRELGPKEKEEITRYYQMHIENGRGMLAW